MPSANLDLVRSILAAWGRGDFSPAAQWAHAEIEYVVADGPAPDSRTRVAGMAETTGDWLAVCQEWRVDAEEYRELDDERVIALIGYGGRGRTSGLGIAQVRTEGLSMFHIRDGKVTRLVFYLDRERALSCLGLAAKDAPVERKSDRPQLRDV